MKLFLLLLLLVANCFAAVAQNQEKQTADAFIRENNAKRARNPEGLSFTVRSKDNRRQFQQGEAITVELSFASSKPNTFTLDNATYDRSGRLNIDAFILDRRDGVVDPLDDYFYSLLYGFIGGGLHGYPELTDKPYLVTAELNEWMRFDKPGHYRLYVESNRVGRKLTLTEPLIKGGSSVSNVVEFDILPADRKWANQKLNEAITALSKPDGDRRSACRTLRFLGTTAAVTEMRKRFYAESENNCEWEYKFGLVGSPHRDFVIRDMEGALSSPEQPVTSSYLSTLALLEFSRQSTPLSPYPNGNDEQNREWQALMEQRRSAYDQLRLNYLRKLVPTIPQKQGKARAMSLQTLVDYQEELNTNEASALLATMPEVFRRLTVRAQIQLLEYQWRPIANPAMLPVLRDILKEAEKPHDNYQQQLRSQSLRRLYELSPDEGRALILDEIRSPNPHFSTTVLRSLPDETLPELDSVLADNLQKTRGPNSSGDADAITDLIQRYATAEILPQVRAVYEAPGVGRWACRPQASFLAYFLRVDPALGGEHLKKAVVARGGNLSGCYTSTLTDVARLHMSREVEEAAISVLDDDDSEVVSSAAGVLGAYGSAGAEEFLWRRLEKWHEAMQSRNEELRKRTPGLPKFGAPVLSDQASIQQSLVTALATGRGWLADPEKLKRLRDLCLTDQGRGEVDQMIRHWNHNIYVAVNSVTGDVYSISVAQYQPKSIDSLKEKLLQFPKGTLFKWTSGPTQRDETKEIYQQLKTFLEDHGMKLETDPE